MGKGRVYTIIFIAIIVAFVSLFIARRYYSSKGKLFNYLENSQGYDCSWSEDSCEIHPVSSIRISDSDLFHIYDFKSYQIKRENIYNLEISVRLIYNAAREVENWIEIYLDKGGRSRKTTLSKNEWEDEFMYYENAKEDEEISEYINKFYNSVKEKWGQYFDEAEVSNKYF